MRAAEMDGNLLRLVETGSQSGREEPTLAWR